MMPRILAFVERDIRLALSYPSTLFMPLLSAVVSVGGFAFLSRIVNPHARLDAGGAHIDYFTYVVINMAFMAFLNAALQCVPQALRRDQVAGTLEPIVAAPSALWLTVMGSAVWPLVFALLQTAAYIVCAHAFGMHLGRVNFALLAQFLLLGTACTGAIGVLASAAVIAFKQSPPSSLLVGSAATLLSGVLFPIALLPPALRAVSWLLPLTHALRGLRAAAGGAAFSTVSGDAVWLAGATALLLPLAYVALRMAVRYAKTDGSLSAY
jgi:ABC-2 type transport system permease protein